MSSVSDPYQPIEKKLKLTREVLENLDKRIKLCILTKSDLVLRDVDIFKRFENIEVGLTINSFNGSLKKVFEPFSPANEKRIRALKILKENKIKTYTFVSPIIPGLIDLEDVIKKTKGFADFYWFEIINIRLAGEEFIKILKKKFPKSFEIIKDKKKFDKFIKEYKNIIDSEKINIRGIEIH
ncbi:radical SAM protein, partial [bacterium]|nr:radical SAM protein [bacterium]